MHCCKNLFLLNVKDLYSHMLCRSPSHDIYWGLEIGLRGLIRASSADIGHAFLFGLLVDPFQQLFRLPFSAGTGGISVGLPIGWVENSIWMEWKCIFYDITNGESHCRVLPARPSLGGYNCWWGDPCERIFEVTSVRSAPTSGPVRAL